MKAIFVETHENHIQKVTFPRRWLPVSTLTCISNLKKNGVNAIYLSYQELQKHPISHEDYLFLVTSDLHLWQCPPLTVNNCKRIVDEFRDQCPIYLIGYHGTRMPALIHKTIRPTGIILGEPEDVVTHVCKDQAHSVTLSNIFPRPANSSHSEPHLIDMNTMPIPEYGIINPLHYRYEIMGWDRFFLFEFARGCFWNCSFCPHHEMYGKCFRSKSADQVINEITNAITQHHISSAYFIDLNFLDDFESKSPLFDYLTTIKNNFSWCCQTRLDGLTDERLAILSASGCKLIHVGIETSDFITSGEKTNLLGIKALNRRLKKIHKFGIKTLAFYIVGKEQKKILTKSDLATMLTMLNVKSTFSSLHQYIPYNDDAYVKACLEGDKNPLQNLWLSFAITFFQILFYLHPSRVTTIFMNIPFRKQLELILFFIKRTFNVTTKQW